MPEFYRSLRCLITIYFIIALVGNGYAQLSGTYTIGGSSPDYSTITAAVSALQSNGVSGSVTFNIRQGTYNERVTIQQISGANSSNTITFQSDPSNTQTPVVQSNNTSNSAAVNFIWRFADADFITIKGLHLKALNSIYSRVIVFQGTCANNIISDNIIEAPQVISTNSDNYVVFNQNGSSNQVTFSTLTRNEIIGGSIGIRWQGGYESGNHITQNDVKNWYMHGIWCDYQYDVIVGNNEIHTNSVYTSKIGIYTAYCDRSSELRNNKIHLTTTGSVFGIYNYYCDGTSSFPFKVYNNFVTVEGSNPWGVYSYRSTYNQLYYNSINVISSGSNGAGFYFYSNSTGYTPNEIRNNSVKSTAYALYYSGTNTRYNTYTTFMDYNNWFTSGSNLVYYQGNRTSLSQWQSLSSRDGNSISVDPGYYSNTDLHTSSISLDGAAQIVSGYTADIDGHLRSSTNPDIGADEFDVKANDAGVSAINQSYCAGSDTVKVTIRNNGTSTLTSVNIGWMVKTNNGRYVSQSPYSWTGSLSTGNSSEISLGTFNFPADTNIEIKAFTYSPNSATDSVPNNDTSETGSFKTLMSGTYSIGGSSPDFNTISLAINELINTGMCGSVTLQVRQGTYNERVHLRSIPGLSAANRLTIESDPQNTNKPLFTQSANTLLIDGANYTTIKGLEFRVTGASMAVRMNQSTTDLVLDGNKISGYGITNSNSTSYSTIYTQNLQHTNLTIKNNEIFGGSYGLHIACASNVVSGKARITGNEIHGFASQGIYCAYLDEAIIQGNDIEDGGGNTSTTFGIQMTSCDLTEEVSRNRIVLKANSNTRGMNFSFCFNTNTNRGIISNNMISLTATLSYQQYGILHSSSNFLTTAYNSILLKSSSTNSYGLYFGGGDQNFVMNNNVVVNRGYTLYTNSTINVDLSNANNLYQQTAGSNFAYWAGNRSNLAALQSASSKDINSISVPVAFDADNDLHTSTTALDGKGIPVSGISLDFDGQPRDATSPDIGADEFIVVANDGGISDISTDVCTGTSQVYVTLRNYGTANLTSDSIYWSVSVNNGPFVAQTPVRWTGTLAPGTNTASVNVGSYSFSSDSVYVIAARSSAPNNSLDSNSFNDTDTTGSFKPKLSGSFTIGATGSDYASFAAAMSDLESFGVCGPVTFNVKQGTYNERFAPKDISGANDTNRITFRADPANTGAAALTFSSYPLYVTEGDYFTIKGLQISVTGSSYAVLFAGSVDGFILDSNTINGSTINNTSTSYSTIYGSGVQLNDLKVVNNKINNGSHGIYLNLSTSSSDPVFSNNRIEDFYYQGAYLINAFDLTFNGNYIEDRGNFSNVFSAYFNNCDNISSIANNQIINNSTSTSQGIYLNGCNNSSSDHGKIYNNMISLMRVASVWQYGIFITNSTYQTIAFNNILSRSTYNYRSFGLYFNSSSNNRNYNNIVKMDRGMAVYYRNTSVVSESGHNLYYTLGSFIGYMNGNRSTLAQLQSASGKEGNSVAGTVGFVSNTDLHVATGQSLIASKGKALAGITTDFDGDPRDASSPYIGADEAPPVPNDAGLSWTKELYCKGNQPFEVRLKNYGTNNLTSTTINILLQANGGSFVAQTPLSWTGNLAPGRDTLLTFGSNNFVATSVYSIIAYTTTANGGADTSNYNDTAYSASSRPGLSGIYTVGGTGADYATPQLAVSALSSSGLCGAVRFQIQSGTYTGLLNLPQVNGSSSTNTILFEPHPNNSSPVILTNSGTAVQYSGMEFVTVKGLNIQSSGSGTRVYFANIGEGSVLENNKIVGQVINNASASYSVIRGSSNADYGNLTIRGNEILNGSYSIYLAGNSTNSSNGLNISNNSIKDFFYFGVLLTYMDGLVLSGNHIEDKGLYSNVYSVQLSNCDNVDRIEGNKVVNRCYNTGWGIYAVNSYSSSNNRTLVANNSVSMLQNTSVGQYGIYLNNCTYYTLAHNSISHRSSSTSTAASAFYIQNGDQIYLYNNNVGCERGYPLYTNSTANIDSSDNNNFFSRIGSYVAYWGGNRTTISNLSSASGGKNSNSVDTDPKFFSTTDLHTNSAVLDSAAKALSYVTTDIDGEQRNSNTPDIGCDEFRILEDDAGIDSISSSVCPGSSGVLVTLTNYGTEPLTSATIHWAIEKNGGVWINQTPYNWTGSLAPSASAIVTVGSFGFQTDTNYRITAYSALPNSTPDSANANDTSITTSFRTSMTGTYTIGGTSPSFPSISSAISDLSTYGVCGPVVFNIRQGSYNGQIALGTYEGVSATNNITFQSDPGNTNDVILTSSTTTLYFNNAKHISVKGVRIQTTSSGNRIYLNGNNEGITIENNTIVGFNTTSSSSYYTLNTSSGKLTDIVIKGNDFTYGTYALSINGNSSNRNDDVTIEDNTFEDFVREGIRVYYTNKLTIKGNELEDRGSYGTVFSINVRNGELNEVTGNKVINRGFGSTYGIYLDAVNNSNTKRGIVANNMIALTNTATNYHYALALNYCNYQTVAFNSILSRSSLANSYTVYFYQGDNHSFFNNNIESNNGYPLYTNSVSNIDFSNFNNLYSRNGSNVAYWGGNRTSISSLSAASSGKNSNSKSIDPSYESSTDLHTDAVGLNAAGTPISGITVDFDGQTRNSTTPDIGADEFDVRANDAGVDSVVAAICSGNAPVQVVITNKGTSTLSSATINWSVKTGGGAYVAQTPFSWTGTLASEQSAVVAIGSFTFSTSSIYGIKAYTTLPNNVTDSNNLNDTSSITGMKTSMSGTFTIGGSNPDYTSFAAAIADMNSLGICDTVIFNVRQGTYNESVNLIDINGTSNSSWIIFQSDAANTSKPVISNGSWPLRFSGMDHVVMKGFRLITTSSSYRIYFSSNTDHAIIDDFEIIGYNTTSTSNFFSVYAPSNVKLTDVSFRNSLFQYGTYGVYLQGSSTNRHQRVEFSGNKFQDFVRFGFHLIYSDNTRIVGNEFEDRGVTSTVQTIAISNGSLDEISRNKIINNATGSAGQGIFLALVSNTSTDRGIIANNMITITRTTSVNQMGILLDRCNYQTIAFNSILTRSSSLNGWGIYTINGSNLNILNNSIETNYGVPLYVRTTSAISISNYNNLYSSNGSFVAYWGNSNRTSISNLSTYSGKDLNSISVDPQYESQTDLHAKAIQLDGAGTPVSGITVDFDNHPRDVSTPDIGADEFILLANDAGVDSVVAQVCSGSAPVSVQLVNAGTSNLSSASIGWLIKTTGNVYRRQTNYSWTGNLSPDQSVMVNIGNYNFSADSTYEIQAFAFNPNSVADSNRFNDTTAITGVETAMSGVYTIGGSNPDFSTINAAITALNGRGVCANTTFNIRSGIYNEQLNFGQITGANSTSRVTFQTDPGASSRAIVRTTFQTIHFNNAEYITVKNLSIQGTSSYNRILFSGVVEGVKIDSNQIIGFNTTSTSGSYSSVFTQTATLKDVEITNNNIPYGSNSIYLRLNTNKQSNNIKIENNVLDDFAYWGIYVRSGNEVTVKGNIIEDRGSNQSIYSIYFDDCDEINEVASNKIINNSTGNAWGIYFTGCQNTSDTGMVYNNMISLLRTWTVIQYGIQFNNSCSNFQVAYNSILSLSSRNAGAYGLMFNNGTGFTNYNNVVDMNRGYAFWVGTASSMIQSDYNLYYTTGSYLARWSGSNLGNIAGLRSFSGMESKSFSGNVPFTSNTDLHLGNTTAINKGKGVPIAGITTDIDGDPRDLTNPDLGADEGDPVNIDAGISWAKDIYCAGNNPFEFTLKNFGTQNLTSVTINIRVSVNGGSYVSQTPINWTGNLSSQQDTTFNYSNYNFITGNNYSVIVSTTSPNNGTDQATYNDSKSSLNARPGMSGIYTVGGTNPDYATPTAALSAINTNGLCGPVTFNIRPGTYTGALTLGTVTGSSPTNRVIFQTEPGSTSRAVLSNAGWSIFFNGMEYITIKNLRIVGTNIGNRIYFSRAGKGTVLDSNEVIGPNVSSVSTSGAVIYGTANVDFENVTVKDNFIQYGSAGIWFQGSSSNTSIGLKITGNEIRDFSTYGIAVDYQDQLVIKDNIIVGNSGGGRGLQIGLCDHIREISGNQITMNNQSASYGMVFGTCLGTSNSPAPVFNNTISMTSSSSLNSAGIYLFRSEYFLLAHNSININSSSSNSKGIEAYYGNANNAINNNVRARSGYPFYCNNRSWITISHNNWYNQFGQYPVYWNGGFTSIASVQTYSGKFQQTLSIPTGFTSLTDLHTNAIGLNGKGIPVNGVTHDFDGEPRSPSTPDIGADEFSLSDIGASAVLAKDSICAGLDTVRVVIKNYGQTTLTSATINWYLKAANGNPVQQTAATFSGSLASNGTSTLQLGTVNLVKGPAYYDIIAVTSSPNNGNDENSSNDTAVHRVIMDAGPTISFSLLAAKCVDATSFTLSAASPTGGTYSGSGVVNGVFSPSAAGVGSHAIVYSLTGPNGCTSTDTAIQVVDSLPTVSFSNLNPVCLDASSFSLSGGAPAGGNYSGTGVSSGSFDPALAGSGPKVITYTFTDANGCSDNDTSIQVVRSLPSVSLSLSAVCANNATFTLSGGSPSGGSYSGTGVNSGSFDPSIGSGSYPIVYSFTDVNGCSNSDTTNQVVDSVPVVNFPSLPELCSNDNPLTLSNATPSGGSYSGSGVNSNSFDPSAVSSGSHVITYTYADANNCSDSDTSVQIVKSSPTVTLSAINPVCVNRDPFLLSGGSPSGGTYTGSGVISGLFSPALAGVGSANVTYRYIAPNGCSAADTVSVVINSAPNVTLSLAPTCNNLSPVALSGGLPSGGTYKGTYVSNGSFDPIASGAGTFPITYTFTNSNNCSDSSTFNQKVNAAPIVSFANLSAICENASNLTLTGGIPSNGSYSGSGVTSGVFNPATAGVGNHILSYSYTDSNSCSDSDTSVVQVKAKPTVSFSQPNAVCANASSFTLTGGLPVGGNYRGTSVTNGVFDPASAGAGSYAITYSYTANNGCSDSISRNQVVYAAPTTSLNLAPVCSDTGSISLSTGTPTGGVYSGSNVSSGSFNASVAGAGSHVVSYTYTNSNNCVDSTKDTITVLQAPTVSFANLNSVCIGTSAFNLSGGSPSGGIYSGSGVNSGSFNSSTAGVGNHIINYYYKATNGCDASDTSIQVVKALPSVSHTSLSSKCADDTAFVLNGGAPANGTYSGNGIVGTNYFNPDSSGSGTHTLTYTVTGTNGCVNSTTVNQFVSATPVVSITSIPATCDNTPNLTLSGSTPSGGSYSGSGISGSTFSPSSASAGSYPIVYTYSNQFNCTSRDTTVAIVHASPSAALSPIGPICVDSNAFALSQGSPVGGVYSGPGVSSGQFDPGSAGAGLHVVKYVYTDTNNCMDSNSTGVRVNALPIVNITLPSQLCTNTSLSLTTGTPNGGSYFGAKVSGSTYTPSGVSNDTIGYSFTDTNGCTNSITDIINTVAPPAVSFGTISDVCIGSIDSVILSTGLPVGGVYLGPKVKGNKVGVGQVGTETLWYVVTQGVCMDSSSQTVTVNPLPSVGLSMTNVCDNSLPFAIAGGSPTGGNYFGKNVVMNDYHVVLGGGPRDTVYYSYTDNNNCTDTATQVIEVYPSPVVSLTTPDSLCSADQAVTLNGGLPIGGIYSGPGVSSGDFTPSSNILGSNNIRYVYIDGNNCQDSAFTTIEVGESPVFDLGGDKEICGSESITLATGLSNNFTHNWNDGSSGVNLIVKSGGVYSVEVHNPDYPQCRAGDTITVDYNAICLSLDQHLAENTSLDLFPNPSNGKFTLEMSGFSNMAVSLMVSSLQGKEVYFKQLEEVSTHEKVQIDLSAEPSGIYLVRIATDQGTLIRRLTISR